MTEPETFTDPHSADPGPGRRPAGDRTLGTILLFFGAALCLAGTLEKAGGLPFAMPWFWHRNLALWIGLGVAALVAGSMLLRPPPGDEHDTR